MRFYRNSNTEHQEARSNLNIADLTWYVVRTPPLREFNAETILSRRGYTIFCPVKTIRIRANRTTKKKKPVEVALMPGYVLMGFKGAPDWHKLFRFGRRQDLVTSVVGQAGRALPIPESSLHWVAKVLDTGDVQVPHEEGFGVRDFTLGDNVEVLDGSYAGHVVRVQELNANSATCLIKIFGGEQKCKISVDNLQKVA
jgi:transcription antitermination factor NusG